LWISPAPATEAPQVGRNLGLPPPLICAETNGEPEETPMPHSRYFVLQDRDDWLIRFHGEEFGPYLSQQEAILFAVDAAQKLGERGEAAEVCLMGENGHFRAQWRYGRDSYPPAL
jgi:hypothetical protein